MSFVLPWVIAAGAGVTLLAVLGGKHAANASSTTRPQGRLPTQGAGVTIAPVPQAPPGYGQTAKPSTPAPQSTPPPTGAPAPSGAPWELAVRKVIGHESGGRYEALNPVDSGISFGLIQWNQKWGGLGELLRAFHAADPAVFQQIFDPKKSGAAQALLKATETQGIRPAGGLPLGHSTWRVRFAQAGKHSTFRRVQDRLAREGSHAQAALRIAKGLGLGNSPKGLAMVFDTAVQQGPGAAEKIAAVAAKKGGGSEDGVIRAFAAEAIRRAGTGAFGADVQRRRSAILADAALPLSVGSGRDNRVA